MAMNMTAAVNIKANVDGLAQIQGLEKALGNADKQANNLSQGFSRLGSAARGIGTALAGIGAAAIGGVAVIGKRAIDAADNLNDLSQRTGVGVETLSKFGSAAEDSGSSLDEVGKSMGKLARGMADSSSATSEALRSIGVSTVDSTGKLRGVDEVMLDIADRFSKLPEGAEKTALAMDIFGKAGANLIPMLNGGSAAINEYSATITTEMAQAADAFNDAINAIMRELAGPFNEAVTAALPYITQLAQELGDVLPGAIQALVPVLQGLLGVLGQIGQWFTSLSPQTQTFVIAAAALTVAFIALAPAITAVISVATALGPIIASVAAAIAAAPAVIAGFAGALAPLGAALLTLGKILIGVFTGPVGWVALAVAAGIAIYAFRDKIADAFGAIGRILVDAAAAFKRTFVDPVVKLAGDVVKGIANAFRGLADALRSPFDAVTRFIRNIFNGYLSLVEKFINSAVNGINKLIAAANRALSALKLPNIPLAPTVTIPRFAQGGTVDRPTLAMVGEGGQREYIIPESKMARASANYLMGARGAGVVPGATSSASQGNTTVQITTGPVLQQGGQRYVTIEDLERSLNSLAANLLGNNRSFAGRRFQGAI